MNRKKKLLLLALVTIIGSFICFYATNLLLSDLANMYMMSLSRDIISGLPLFMIALEFVLAAIGIIRDERRPEYRKAQLNNYMTLLLVFSCIGILTVIATCTLVYGSFLAPYPFKGYSVICSAWHLIAIAVALALKKKIAEMPDDQKVRHKLVRYRVHTFFLMLGMFFAFDRFGALLWAPVYIHMRSLCITWPFYLSLLLPLAVVGDNIIYAFRLDKDRPEFGARYIGCVVLADIILGYVVMFKGMKNSLFISAISPALGLERLATFPIDTIIQFSLVLILGIYSLRYALIGKNRK